MDWSDSLQKCRSGGTLLKSCCESSWLPLILSQPLPQCHNHHPNLTIPSQTITCVKHRPTITFWCLFVRTTDQLEQLVRQGKKTLYYNVLSILGQTPCTVAWFAPLAHLFKGLPRGRSGNFGALILCLGGRAPWFYVSDTFWWIFYILLSYTFWQFILHFMCQIHLMVIARGEISR